MDLDYSHKGECRVTMYGYLDGILHTFNEAVKKHGKGWVVVQSRAAKKTAAPDNLFAVDEDCEKLSIEAAASFHTVVAKLLYISKQARPDTSLSAAFLTTRVRAHDTDDWGKLSHLMEYLRADKNQLLLLGGKNEGLLMWYMVASFAVHPNMHSHTRGGLTMGRGFPISVSTKQKAEVDPEELDGR